MRVYLTACALVILTGCAGIGNDGPLADVPRLSDVETIDASVAMTAPKVEAEGGFFSQFFGGGQKPDAVAAPVETAPASPDAPQAPPAAKGFFGNLLSTAAVTTSEASRPDAVAPMTLQPFGAVGVTCGLSKRDLGTQIADTAGFKVYDTASGSIAPRPHYITGFKDGCARQFTSALVLLGDVGTHEVVRYETAQSKRSYTTVDSAYEAIKAGFCRAGHGAPCGRKIDALSRKAVFITGYERFASSPTWVEILLYDGEVAAVGVERQ